MTSTESQPAAPEPKQRWFQYSLRTLLVLFVVLSSSLAVFGPGGIVVFALAVGLAVYVHQVASLRSLRHPAIVVFCLMCLIGLTMLSFLGRVPREAVRRAFCTNNLKQIALALHNYHEANGCFPPAYIANKNGKPMHSWRVLILPYMDYNSLHKTYDFTEPWDGPKNKNLFASRPPEYACPSDPDACNPSATQTNYVAVVGPNAAWAGGKSRKYGPVDFPGGTSNTIMLVEVVDSGIPWTEPRDLSLDTLGADQTKVRAFAVSSRHGRRGNFFFTYEHRYGANVAMADGSARYLSPSRVSTENLRKILQVGAYREEEIDSDDASYGEELRLNWPNVSALAVWLLSVGVLLYRAVRSRADRQSIGPA